MGNCLCVPDPDSDSTNDVGLLPASKQVFDKDFLQIDYFGGTHFASSAHFASSQNQNTFSIIHQCSQDTVLIGLVVGVGVDSALTVGFVQKRLLSTFQEACQHHGGLDQHNQEDILSATLQSLHHKCLASPNLRFHNKDCQSGASVAVALVNLDTRKCTTANVGNTRCLLAGVSGSFNSKRPHHTWVSTLHTTENQSERIHINRHGNYALIPLSSRNTDSSASQPVYLTRALGIANKSGNSASYTYQRQSNKVSRTTTTTASAAAAAVPLMKNKFDVEVDVNSFQLNPTEDSHLIIGSAGFWEIVAPPAVALRAHLFSQFQKAQNRVKETSIKEGVPLPSPAKRASFLAEHLLNLTLSTAADKHTTARLGIKTNTMSAEELKNLPFKISITEKNPQDEVNTSDKNNNGNGTDLLLEDRVEEENHQLVRKDVFNDLACVAISFQWPNTGHQSMFQSPPPPRVLHPKTVGAISSDLAPLARYRWSQLRMVADYHRLYRREVLQRWHETVNGIFKKANRRAKAVAYQVENEHGIAVNVSPLMKLSAKDGHALPRSVLNVRASINF